MSVSRACTRRAPRSRAWIGPAVLLVSATGAPPVVRAQDTGLSKSELVRLVVSSSPTSEKVQAIRSRCLSFEPTEGDWRDLGALGASDEVVAAARDCARATQAVRVALSAASLAVGAGDSVAVYVTLTRSGSPVAGQVVTLSGNGVRLSRSTGGNGVASFRLAAGTSVGSARYSVSAAGLDLEGPTRITVSTVAGPAARASASPGRIDLERGDSLPEIRFAIEDRFGNPGAGAAVRLYDGPGVEGSAIADGEADGSGVVVLRPDVSALSDGEGAWELRSGEVVLATLPVRVRSAPVSVAAVPVGRGGPSPVDSAVADGLARLEAGDAAGAERAFREALRVSPRRIDAQKGLAATLLSEGRPDESAVWYELATRQDPGDVEAWAGLGQAYAASGRRQEASSALARARELDPTLEDLDDEITELSRSPGYATGLVWGGTTNDSGESGGIRRGELEISFSAAARVWGVWDRSLSPGSPELIRGPDEWDGWLAGAGWSYGSGHRLGTEIELGQRKQSFGAVDEDAELAQNVYRLTQVVRFAEARRAAELRLGGYVGRWYDADDWLVFGRLRAPVGPALSVVSSVSYGKTIGTNWLESGRHADSDGRAYLGVAWETPEGLRVEPLLGVGSVSSDRDEELSGTLVDLLLEGSVPIGRAAAIQLFVRHQRPPGTEPFTVLAAGLGLRVGWAGG